jgi:hypothetical protein
MRQPSRNVKRKNAKGAKNAKEPKTPMGATSTNTTKTVFAAFAALESALKIDVVSAFRRTSGPAKAAATNFAKRS